MAFQAGRPVVRLPQLALQYLGNRRTVLSSSCIERVPALYNVSQSQQFSDLVFNYRLGKPALSRAYAQRAVSRPKAHTGRTTTAARKAPTTSKTKAAKKPAPKKTTPKAVPKAKSKAKPRIKAKPKPAKKKKAKPKPKPKPKAKKPKKPKVLTEAQKKALTIKKLRVTALKPPTAAGLTVWGLLLAEKVHATDGTTASRNLGAIAKEASAEYKQLTPERLEHYNHLANQNKAANDTAYRQWIESHTPAVIYNANIARLRLRQLGVKAAFQLQDHRQVKGPRNAFLFFHIQRRDSGDFKGLKVSEAAKLAGREWMGLSASEKKAFEDMAAQDTIRYRQERKTVLNKDVRPKKATA